MKNRLRALILLVIAVLVLGACETTDHRRITEIFDSGEIIECNFREAIPQEHELIETGDMRISYARGIVLLENLGTDNYILITRTGTYEPLDQERHSRIYDTAFGMGCEYIVNEQLSYEIIRRALHTNSNIANVFGGIPFITDESRTLQGFENNNRDKIDFRCKAIIPDGRMEDQENSCSITDFDDILV